MKRAIDQHSLFAKCVKECYASLIMSTKACFCPVPTNYYCHVLENACMLLSDPKQVGGVGLQPRFELL